MFDRLSQEQFNYIIEAMCLYKTLNPEKTVTLSVKTVKEAVKDKQVPVVDLIAVQTRDPFKVLVATILSARTKDVCYIFCF